MLDVNLVRDNPGIIKKDLKKRGSLGKLKIVDENPTADTQGTDEDGGQSVVLAVAR